MSDTEQRLRLALQAAGTAITAEPAQFHTDDGSGGLGGPSGPEIDTPRRPGSRRRRWEWWATAAAVVALGVTGVGIGLAHHGPDQPALTRPVPGRLHALACTVALPHSWRGQLRAGVVTAGGGARLTALGVAAGGYTVAADAASTPQSIVVISPDRTVHRIWQPRSGVPVNEGFAPANAPAVVDGRWVVFALVQQGGSDQPPFAFYAANTRTGRVEAVTPGALAHTRYSLAVPVAAGGSVYFSATSSDNGLGVGPGYIYAYDLTTGRRRILDRGDVGRVSSAGGGVFWQHGKQTVTYRPGSAPPGYPSDGTSLITDGTRQAWIQYVGHQGSAVQMRIGTGKPVTLLPGFTLDNVPELMALSGPYLVVSDNAGLFVLDTRSGAQTRIAKSAFAAGTGHTVAITESAARTSQLSVIDTTKLPALRC